MFAYTISGRWGYLERPWTATAGDFVYEAPGEGDYVSSLFRWPVQTRVRVIEHDVRDEDGLARLISAAPQLGVLVNCAGVSHDRREYDLEPWRVVLDVNLTATMVACQAARPGLARAGGCVVNVSSMFAFFGSKDRPAYSASKGGVSQLTRSLAAEYAPQGIRVARVIAFLCSPAASYICAAVLPVDGGCLCV